MSKPYINNHSLINQSNWQQQETKDSRSTTFIQPLDRSSFRHSAYKGVIPSPIKTPDHVGGFINIKQKYKELGSTFNLKDYFEMNKQSGERSSYRVPKPSHKSADIQSVHRIKVSKQNSLSKLQSGSLLSLLQKEQESNSNYSPRVHQQGITNFTINELLDITNQKNSKKKERHTKEIRSKEVDEAISFITSEGSEEKMRLQNENISRNYVSENQLKTPIEVLQNLFSQKVRPQQKRNLSFCQQGAPKFSEEFIHMQQKIKVQKQTVKNESSSPSRLRSQTQQVVHITNAATQTEDETHFRDKIRKYEIQVIHMKNEELRLQTQNTKLYEQIHQERQQYRHTEQINIQIKDQIKELNECENEEKNKKIEMQQKSCIELQGVIRMLNFKLESQSQLLETKKYEITNLSQQVSKFMEVFKVESNIQDLERIYQNSLNQIGVSVKQEYMLLGQINGFLGILCKKELPLQLLIQHRQKVQQGTTDVSEISNQTHSCRSENAQSQLLKNINVLTNMVDALKKQLDQVADYCVQDLITKQYQY